MLSKTILAFAGLIAAAQAILVTSPAKDSKLDFSSTIKVEWTSVNTDPTTFELVLVDQNNMTPISISKGVKSSDHEYTLSNFAANPGTYKFNFLSEDPLNTGILAQSQTFTITKSGGPEESETTSSTTSTSTSKSSPTGTAGESDSTSSDSSSTITTKTSSGTPSKTSGAANASNTADASSTGTAPVKSDNAAAALNGKTFGIAGGLFAGLLMLF